MTKKFTEEQYQKIVNLQEDEYRFSILEGGDDYSYGFWRRLIIVAADIASFANENKLIDELAALANPLTREWARDRFVEKEKRYVWTLNRNATWNGVENYKRLFRTVNGDISDVLKEKDEDIYEEEYLTESEIREWGYNPDMFDKGE